MLNRDVFEPYKDMFNIYKLITKINKNYRLFFNKKDKNFLIVNIKNSDEICLKFTSFSENILENLQKSQTIFSHKIFSEIERENEVLNAKISKNFKYNTFCKLEEVSKYSKRTNKILQSDFNKIIEVWYAKRHTQKSR